MERKNVKEDNSDCHDKCHLRYLRIVSLNISLQGLVVLQHLNLLFQVVVVRFLRLVLPEQLQLFLLNPGHCPWWTWRRASSGWEVCLMQAKPTAALFSATGSSIAWQKRIREMKFKKTGLPDELFGVLPHAGSPSSVRRPAPWGRPPPLWWPSRTLCCWTGSPGSRMWSAYAWRPSCRSGHQLGGPGRPLCTVRQLLALDQDLLGLSLHFALDLVSPSHNLAYITFNSV